MMVIMRLPETCSPKQREKLEELLRDKRSVGGGGGRRSRGGRGPGEGGDEGVQQEASYLTASRTCTTAALHSDSEYRVRPSLL